MVRVIGILLVGLLGGQMVAGVVAIVSERRAVTAAERRFAASASEKERVDLAVRPWGDVVTTIRTHVPEAGVVGFHGPLDQDGFAHFFRIAVLCHPRRFAAPMRAFTLAEIEGGFAYARQLGRPVFLVDFRSGLPLPRGIDEVATGATHTLWRFQ